MITTTLQGRCGNIFYQCAFLMAYTKRYGLEYYIPDRAYHCDGNQMYFPHLANGPELQGMKEYHELQVHATPNNDGTYNYNTPAYLNIPMMDNVKFVGYWQSFQYIDWGRDYILEKFQLPYDKRTGVVGLHLRRGDFLQLTDKHPPVPIGYYHTAMNKFREQGDYRFMIFSDDITWCKGQFTADDVIFSDGNTELQDLIALSECEHQILCYSTFGFIGAWLNQNPDKIVYIPDSSYCFSGANANFIPNYFTQLPI